ncbi:conserved hypothetical protein [Hyella patelloides LEGE 07179]|uniref:Uncharacterized protein n=1 Tax=Hyella patelloides LEGE 07179 TaxID=945734 RepID=A0A563VSW2_9CYAN|nr:Npun_F0494 family protein [Hyella patelloides]VEP14501.1 conserved hypothetical protein [Hyella patelloides LEGE 07179]
MAITVSTTKIAQYPEKTVKRAARAFSCSPFKLKLFVAMQNQSIPLPTIANNRGIENNYTPKAIAESKAESHLVWLINVGLLRREVDGQGITDSFRLTPLGRQIIAQWEAQGEMPQPSLSDRILNWLSRWLRY